MEGKVPKKAVEYAKGIIKVSQVGPIPLLRAWLETYGVSRSQFDELVLNKSRGPLEVDVVDCPHSTGVDGRCVARDGELALENDRCVGCGKIVAELFFDIQNRFLNLMQTCTDEQKANVVRALVSAYVEEFKKVQGEGDEG
jgi:hypothetical protein